MRTAEEVRDTSLRQIAERESWSPQQEIDMRRRLVTGARDSETRRVRREVAINVAHDSVGKQQDKAFAVGLTHRSTVAHYIKKEKSTPVQCVRLDLITDAVCETLGVGFDDLIGVERRRRVVLAREVVSYLARRLTTLSFPEIARGIGRPTHTTIIAANERFRRRLESDPPETIDLGGEVLTLAELVGRLEAGITGAKR